MPALQNKYFLLVHNQRGAALMLLLLLVSVGALAVFVIGLNRATQQLERDRITNCAGEGEGGLDWICAAR